MYALAARHPILADRSYDLVLNRILERKRQLSRHIFAPLELQPNDFADLFNTQTTFSLDHIDGMTPSSFEEWANGIAINVGLAACLTNNSNDGGVDIVIRDEGGAITHLLQCKFTNRTANPIDAGLSTDLARMRHCWKAASAAVYGITNSVDFTPAVRRVASENKARLVSRDELYRLGQILIEGRS